MVSQLSQVAERTPPENVWIFMGCLSTWQLRSVFGIYLQFQEVHESLYLFDRVAKGKAGRSQPRPMTFWRLITSHEKGRIDPYLQRERERGEQHILFCCPVDCMEFSPQRLWLLAMLEKQLWWSTNKIEMKIGRAVWAESMKTLQAPNCQTKGQRNFNL